MTEEIKQEIKNTVKRNSLITSKTIEEDLQLFEKVLGLSQDIPKFSSLQSDIIDAFTGNISHPNLKLLCAIEPFCKVIVAIVDPIYYQEKESSHFTLSTCIRKLHLLDEDVLEYLGRKDERNRPKIYSSNDMGNPTIKFKSHPDYPLIVAYYCRNIFSHEAPQITDFDYYLYYVNLFLSYFRICEKYKEHILKYCLKENNYITHYIEEYQEKEKQGYTYISTKVAPKGKNEIYQEINDFKFTAIHKDKKIPCIKLIGYAGVGKTSVLEYIRYKELLKYQEEQNRSSKNKKCKLPVIISLIQVTDEKETIESLIAKAMNLELNEINLLLQEKKLNLYFDGVNEIRISNKNSYQNFCSTLEKFILDYANPDTSIIVTDRDNNGLSILNDESITPTFILTKLTDQEMERFILGNMSENKRKEGINIIKTIKEEKPGFYEELRHPYILSQFIYLLDKNEQDIPTTPLEVTDHVLLMLTKREEEEKKNLIAPYIIPALKYVVKNKKQDDEFYISQNDFIEILNDYKHKILEETEEESYRSFDLITLIVKLGIMKKTGLDGYVFTQPSYYLAFLPRERT